MNNNRERNRPRNHINRNRFELVNQRRESPWDRLIRFFDEKYLCFENTCANCECPEQELDACCSKTCLDCLWIYFITFMALLFNTYLLMGLLFYLAFYEGSEKTYEKVAFWFIVIPICFCFYVTYSALFLFWFFLNFYSPLNPFFMMFFSFKATDMFK